MTFSRASMRGTLLLAATMLIAGGDLARAQQPDVEPYSTLTFRAGLTRARTYEPLRSYYPGNTGIAFDVETPFEFGLLGLTVDAISFRGTGPQQVTTSTNTFALEWRRRWSLTRRIDIRPGVRIGDFHMVFQDPHFSDPGATPDHGTEEFLIGPTAAMDVRLGGRLEATVAGAWIYLPAATRMKIAYVTVLGGYTFATPGWLKSFLQ